MHRWFALLPLTALSCTFGDPACEVEGGRTCEHAPECGDVYRPDPQLVLDVEYWRVFEMESGEAYLFPRPDGSPELASACAEGGPHKEILDRYTLCSESPDVDEVNAMTPDDALAIARDLHARLVFLAEGEQVLPFPFLDDLLAICAGSPDAGLDELCAGLPQGPECTEEGRVFTAEEAELLAPALNELYGVSLG